MNKKVVVLGILAVCLSISIVIGFSYSLWTQTEVQSSTNNFESGCFSISLGNESKSINIPNGYPIPDEKGKTQTPYTFTITNTCSIYASYAVNLEKLEGSDLDNQYIKVMLNNKLPHLYNYYSLATKEYDNSVESRTLTTDGLEANESKAYTLRIWLDESGTNETVGGRTFNSKIVVSAVATYQSGAEYITSLLEDNQETMSNDDPDENVRYIGSSPNNYVTFNNELWRIIGVFDTFECSDEATTSNYQSQCSNKKLLKIIRDDLIGNHYWNYDIGDDYKNNWEEATINSVLNDLYYNSDSDTNGKENYDFTSNGLKDDAKKLIVTTIWNLGGPGIEYENSGTAEYFYKMERSSIVYTENPDKWVGKVGLMYPSDYGYATGDNDQHYRAQCLTSSLFYWNNLDNCNANNWLFNSNYDQMTLTASSSYSRGAYGVSMYKNITFLYVDYLYGIRPTVYLKSNVKIIHDESHNGSNDKPYELSL